MAFMMLVVVLFSVFFIAAHADHDCSGEDCPVCACIHQCESMLKGIDDGMAAGFWVIIPAIVFLSFISVAECSFAYDTLVSKKIRMND